MDTPWGPLAGLKLDDPEEAEKILAADKHQLIEGLVAGSLFDQIVACVPETAEQKIIALDVDSAVIDTMRRSERWLCLVWARTECRAARSAWRRFWRPTISAMKRR